MQKKRDQDAGLVADCKRPAFKANRMPDFSSIRIYSEEMKLQEEQRLKRIHLAAEESYSLAKMPRRMQQAMENEKQNPKVSKHQEDFSFKPLINEPKTGAQFKRLQDKFQEQLNKTKSEKRVTVARPFGFNNSKSKPLERAYVNEGGYQQHVINQATGGDKLKAAMATKKSTKSRSSATGPPVKQPSSTRSTALLQERRRKEIEAKKAADEKKAAEDKARIERQNQVRTHYIPKYLNLNFLWLVFVYNQLKGTVQTMLKPTLKNSQAAIDAKAKENRE